MKDKTVQFFTVMLIWSLLLLLVSGCGGISNDKKAGSFIPPKQNSVDAVLQQKKAEADRQNGNVNAGKETADKQKDASDKTGREAPGIQNKQGADGHVTAQKMKELEEMYTQIYNMLKEPDKYKGKVVRMQGTFGHYYDEKTGKHYFGCVVMDATACCSTGMEFSRKGKHKYPENYPKPDEPIIVTGTFSSYKEGKELFCELADAEMEKL